MTGTRLVEGFAVLDDRYYAPSHMWVKLDPGEEGLASIGLDDYFQQSLGLITKVRLPEIGAGPTSPLVQMSITQKICEGDTCTYHTTTIDLPFPVAGEVVAVNEQLLVDPFLIQEDHAESGWLVKLRLGVEGRTQLTSLYRGQQIDEWLRNAVRSRSTASHA